jgi:Tetratricopeptide repeat
MNEVWSIRFRKPRSIALALFLLLIFAPIHHAVAASDQTDVLILKDTEEEPQTQSNGIMESMENEAMNGNGSAVTVLFAAWKNFQDAWRQGKVDQAAALVPQIVDLRNSHGIYRLNSFAMNAVEMGDSELSRGHVEDALTFYQTAQKLDSSFSPAYYGQSRAYLTTGLNGIPAAVSESMRGILAPRETVSGTLRLAARLSLLLLVLGLILALIFSVILLVKYNRLLRHDAIEKFGSRVGDSSITLIVWILLLLPVFFWLGPFWLAPYWLMIFWGYAKSRERTVAILFLVFFVLAYPIYQEVLKLASASSNPSVAPIITAFDEGASPKALRDLQQYNDAHPQDGETAILLSHLYKEQRQYEEAVSALQKYMVKNPLDARAFNNLATIFFMQGEADSALRFVQRAVTLDRRNTAFIYNLSKIYRAKFDFAQAQQKMDEALAMDPQQVRNFEASPQAQLIDVIPETSLVWQKIRLDNQPFWSRFANPFSLLSASLIILTFALYALRGRKIGYARRCTQCGKAFCHKCQSSGRAYDLCAQCMHIFILKDGVSPASRREKMQEIDRYSRRQRMLLSTASLVVPGVGDLMRNRTARGFFILTLWTLLLILIFFYFRPAFGSYDEPGHNDKALALVYIVAMALLYLFANLGGTRTPQRA